MKKVLSILLISIFFIVQMNAQLFESKKLYPDVKSIKGKYFNGSGGKGYWSMETLDEKGRIVNSKSYKKRILLSETEYHYDSNNNEIHNTELFDINHPKKVKTNWHRRYEYDSSNNISYQVTKTSDTDSAIIKLVTITPDSMFTYLETSYHYNAAKNKRWENKKEHKVFFNKDKSIRKWTIENLSDHSKEIKEFWYFSNGALKRRTVKRVPVSKLEGGSTAIYLGGPGSDDQQWEYTYDKNGRVKKMYTIVDGKKYKVAKYKYN